MNKTKTIFNRLNFNVQLALLILAFAAVGTFGAGEVDPTFNTAVQQVLGGTVNRLVVQPDGKLLVAGNFTSAGNAARAGVARLNANGTLDETFSPPDFFIGNNVNSLGGQFAALALQSDGKIIVGGIFDRVGNITRKGVVRLNADGSLDASFNPLNGTVGVSQDVAQIIYDIKIQPDNRIIMGGQFTVYGGVHPTFTLHQNLARFNVDGSIDESFVPPATDIIASLLLQPDGKVVFADVQNNVKRLNADGSGDGSFLSLVLNVRRLALQADGKILAAGNFNKGIVRLNTNGTIDSTFNPSGSGAGLVNDVVVLPDGKILIGGTFNAYNGVARANVARLNADGTLDTTFNYTGFIAGLNVVNAIAVADDGNYLFGAVASQTSENKLVKTNPSGVRDMTYVGDVYMRGSVVRVIAQPDGKVVAGGSFGKINGISRTNIARFNADGSLDTTFNASLGSMVLTVALQSDGKILGGGWFTVANGVQRLSLARFNSDGSLDTAFKPDIVNQFQQPASTVTEIIPLPDGKILIAGKFRLSAYSYELNVARLNANGSTDTSFIVQQVNTVGIVRAMKLQPDGKIVVGGQFTQIAGANRGNVARLNADGTIDTTFSPFSGTNAVVNDLAIQSTGNIIIGGEFSSVNGVSNHYYLAQLFPDGSLNAAFNTPVNNFVYAVERQADDKILVGSFFNINGKRGIARFNTDGSLDNSFAGIGTNDIVRDIFIQSDNKILIGGDFTRVNDISRVGVARLLNAAVTARTPYDFDGDGRADISVFRPSNGVWYLQQSTAGFNGVAFGASSDLITPADYDGDGKTDIAVFRPSNGVWYLLKSSQGFTGTAFGTSGDIPMPADYDGDGKADLAVFRPSNGTWYIQQSTSGFTGVVFGTSGDNPVAADYDGDGKADLAVFRPSNSTWYIQRSQLGFTGVAFGTSGDLPVPADYDGDGKANIAVFRPSNGTWYTSTNPQQNYGAVLFGANGDLPVPADYDGDGKADIAVFRPSNGTWYLNRSTQGFVGVLFGGSTDKPIPNAFIR